MGLSLLGLLIWNDRKGLAPAVSAEDTASQKTQLAVNNQQLALRAAAQSISRGYFEGARISLASLDPKAAQNETALLLSEMLSRYDRITRQTKQAQQDAYNEYLEKIKEQTQTAQWREQMLQASEAFDLNHPRKEDEEARLRQQIQDHWLRALAYLTSSHELAQRVGMEETIAAHLRQMIVNRSLNIALLYEQQKNWNEAFARVYYQLTFLDKQNRQYKKESERLLRMALLENLYIPDPNEDTLPWQEKRRDISFNIFSLALKNIDLQYVEEPDFKEISAGALRYCLYLAQSEKLPRTFDTLKDSDALQKYRDALEQMLKRNEKQPPEYFNYEQVLNLLSAVLKISSETVKLPDEVIIAEFAEGAFSALDGYTYAIWPADVANVRKDITNEFSGIGVLISKGTGRLRIETLLEDSPAARAGLDAGDIIVAIDDRKTANMNIDMAVRRITGKAGTDVVLTIEREDFEDLRDFTITRQHIVVKTVKGLYRDPQGQWQYYLDPDRRLAYIRLTSFAEETTERLRQTLNQLKKQNLRGLVLDLRDNNGGYLSTAIEVADCFITSGVIVSTRVRGGLAAMSDEAHSENTFDDKLPLVILVNAASASASEIVSGALKDHGRALIVGARTFGKGNVQTISPLRPSEAELKNTVAYYYLPSGRRVHKDPKDPANKDYGVEPDVELELTALQNQQILLVRREAETLHQTEGPAAAQKWKTYSAQEVLDSDPQLTLAFLCLKAKLIAESFNTPYPQKLVQRQNTPAEK